MKLYTEEQVRQFLDMYSKEDVDDIISSLTPIELPSDEEIDESNPFRPDGGHYNSSAAFQWLKGAKWMKEQILKQN